MFVDLNVPSTTGSSEEDSGAFAARMLDLGWRCVASTTVYRRGDDTFKRRASDPPSDLPAFEKGGQATAAGRGGQPRLLTLSRVHLAASDVEDNASLVPKCRKVFDLVSCAPETEDQLRKVCAAVDCDIVSIDLAQPLPFRIQPAHVQSALKRGLVFEIVYSKLLRDSDATRRNVFSNARALCRLTRGKGIVIGSGAATKLDLRAPSDVASIATFFDLKGPLARAALDQTPKQLLQRVAMAKAFHRGCRLNDYDNRGGNGGKRQHAGAHQHQHQHQQAENKKKRHKLR
mmetsp:Transcript_61/g.142  ORF Transcript_61/g.142 Transcript_61/m.142 type:complete len:288 (-) Transcript_61:84-947(-)